MEKSTSYAEPPGPFRSGGLSINHKLAHIHDIASSMYYMENFFSENLYLHDNTLTKKCCAVPQHEISKWRRWLRCLINDKADGEVITTCPSVFLRPTSPSVGSPPAVCSGNIAQMTVTSKVYRKQHARKMTNCIKTHFPICTTL